MNSIQNTSLEIAKATLPRQENVAPMIKCAR